MNKSRSGITNRVVETGVKLSSPWILEDHDMRILQSIIEAVRDGVYIADCKGYYVTANEAFEQITGIRREKLLGQHTSIMLEKRWIDTAVNLEVLKEKKNKSKIVFYPSGREILVSAGIIWGDHNKVAGVFSILHDLTELNKIHKELKKSHSLIREYKTRVNFLERQLKRFQVEFIGQSDQSRQIIFLAKKVAHSDATVMITGESGVGKEIIARYIHENSSRKETGELIKVDCASLPPTLLEAELFGYDKGAYTDARREGKPGLFELADKGTLFLDEIGEVPLELQAKLLNAIQDREIKRIGGLKPLPVNVRIITATNVDLEKKVREKQFREDLYYRLNVVPIHIPPLRERKEDIVPLIEFYLAKFNEENKTSKTLSPEALRCLVGYGWPGNVRELRNTLERLVVMSLGDTVTPGDLPAGMRLFCNQTISSLLSSEGKCSGRVGALKILMENYERELIKTALEIHGSLKEAATDLQIDLSTLTRKNRKYRLKSEKKMVPIEEKTEDDIHKFV